MLAIVAVDGRQVADVDLIDGALVASRNAEAMVDSWRQRFPDLDDEEIYDALGDGWGNGYLSIAPLAAEGDDSDEGEG